MRDKEDYWFHPDNFEGRPGQVIWLLKWMPVLNESGEAWPPHVTPETGHSSRGDRFYHGSFEPGETTIARLSNILCFMGRDGAILKLRFSNGDSPEQIGKYFRLPYRVVNRIIKGRLAEIHRDYKWAQQNFTALDMRS